MRTYAALLVSGALTLSCWSSGHERPDGGGGTGGSGGGPQVYLADPGDPTRATTCAGAHPTFPAKADLPSVAPLPDPFTAMDGTRIARRDQWACRRAEIGAQAQQYELGPLPPKPASVSGALDADKLTVNVSDGTRTISFVATITLPTIGTPPYPAMIGLGGVGIGAAQLRAMGVATIVFPNDTVAQQNSASSRGHGVFYDLYGPTHPAGAMIAWTWGVSRLVDALESTPAAQIDPARLGVTGCSRNGKGALIAGAFEERIALTIPQESGSGGAASWRVSDDMYAKGTEVQTLMEITGENAWFRTTFSQFNRAATQLPFDHHMLEGLVAPRALLVVENTSQVWLGNLSTFTNSVAAHGIWEALGIPDSMGFSQIGDHPHCEWNGSQQPEVTAYVQKFLVGGGTGNTSILKTDGGFTLDKATWTPWSIPQLQGSAPGGSGGSSGAGGGGAAGSGGSSGAGGGGAIDAGGDAPTD